MADPDALDAALLPMLNPGPVILDGYPRTIEQMVMLPTGFDVVGLNIDEVAAMFRIKGREKNGWDEAQRMRDQAAGIRQVLKHANLVVNVQGKTPGEIVFEVLSSAYLGPPVRRPD